jgi:hypothetical protein
MKLIDSILSIHHNFELYIVRYNELFKIAFADAG